MTPRRRKMKYLDESRQLRCRRPLGGSGVDRGFRRVAEGRRFCVEEARMGADSGVLIRALSDGPATALTGGSLLRRK